LGEGIKRRREALGLSQEELAHRAGVHPIYVSHVEQASRSVNLYALDKIAEAMNCKPSALFAEAELKAFHAAGEYAEERDDNRTRMPLGSRPHWRSRSEL